ncbi:MAG: aminotransferase class I/II-fold pyridoxal phosphate-dependent enzyme [Chromatiales bacterium]|jgi:8-amino-7-oxononanoate synthase|nr:aminotransferase class I/II-fold pyridoxal phosphate-dependent enzyme [Chromatiales bacterium]
MSLLEKFAPLNKMRTDLLEYGSLPFGVVTERIISPTIGIVHGRETILAGSNNYLGLTFEPSCIEAAKAALDAEGTGTTGSRMANGTYSTHHALEQELAAFFDRQHALVFTTGFLATMGMVSTLAGRDDVLLIDADSHASIYDGCRLGGAEIIRFRHNDPADLEKRLRRLGERSANTLVVAEGLYSMLGDQPPLEAIVDIKDRYGACLLLDEAHSMGVFGAHGRGLAEALDLEDRVEFVVGTFSKSLGSVGGFCVSNLPELDLIRMAARSYIFTASPAPSVVASTREALKLIATRPELRERLWRNANQLYSGLQESGFQVGPQPSPVVAVFVDQAELAIEWWHQLLDNGIYVNLVIPPATPSTSCLLRCSMSAAHTTEQVNKIVSSFADLRSENRVAGSAV